MPSITIDILANTKKFVDSFSQINSMMKSKPLIIPTAQTSATSGNITEANAINTSIKERAVGISEVITKTKEYTDALGQNKVITTELEKTWIGTNGEIYKTTEKVGTGWDNLTKKHKLLKETMATQDFKVFAENLERAKLDVDKMAKSAEDFKAKATNMAGKPAEEVKKLTTQVIEAAAAFGKMGADDKGLTDAYNKVVNLSRALQLAQEKTTQAANANKSWGASLAGAMKQTIAYAASLGLIRMAQQQLREGLQYIIELNKEMVSIQVLQAEGAQTPEEINSLASAYNDLAKAMGVSTLEIAKGSLEWLRQGKSIAETTELLKASTALSKLGNMSAAEATEYLTSTVNSYKLSTEDAIKVVDKLIAVDNKSATSAMELATALRYSAATAAEAGVSLEQLISYIGVVSSVTRMNAESIGQAFKTMLTRMQDIKAGKIDEDGLGINNVESALARVDIKLRDSATSFRDLGGVLEELATKWDTLNEIEQANISKAIAGIRQANMFQVLMQNMNIALGYQKEQFNSAGLAMDRYQIYLEGVEAAQNKLKTSVEGLWQDAIASGAIKSVLDFGTSLAGLVEALGGLQVVLGITIIALAAYKIAVLAAAGAEALWLALSPIGWVVAVVAALAVLAAGFNHLTGGVKRNTDAFRESSKALQDTSDATRSLKHSQIETETLSARYAKLAGTIRRTADEAKEFTDIQNKLHDLFPELSGTYDDNLNFLISSRDVSQQILDIEREKYKVLLAEGQEKGKQAAIDAFKVMEDDKNRLADAQYKRDLAAYNYNQNFINAIHSQKYKNAKEIENLPYMITLKSQLDAAEIILNEAKKSTKSFELTLKDIYMRLGVEARKALIEGLDPNGTNSLIQGFIKKVNDTEALQAEVNMAKMRRDAGMSLRPEDIFGKATDALTYASALSEITDGLEGVNAIKKAIAENGGILPIDKIKDAEKLGLVIEKDLNGNLIITEKSLNRVTENAYYASDAFINLTPELQNAARAAIDLANAEEATTDAFFSNQQMLESVMESYRQTGELTYQQMIQMMKAGYAEAIMIDVKTGKITLDTIALHYLVVAEAEVIATEAWHAYQLALTGNALDTETRKLWLNWQALDALAKKLKEMPDAITIPTYDGGGGGGGGGKSEEEIRLEGEIKLLEKKKKALQDQLEEYKKYIAAQKESLKRMKEEKDFTDELMKKNLDLAKLKARITILSLDDSEEATAERLKLEEEAGQLETEITKDKEDRKYELQIQALDDLEKAFEEMINKQIEAIDTMIDKLREQISALQKGSSSGANTIVKNNDKIKMSYAEMMATITQMMKDTFGEIDVAHQAWVDETVEGMLRQGKSYDEILEKLREMLRLQDELSKKEGTTPPPVIPPPTGKGCFIAGTMVSMADGTITPIEKINVGDLIKSYDFEQDKLIDTTITETLHHKKEEVEEYIVLNDFLSVTPNHAMYVEGWWKPVKDLTIGEYLTDIHGVKIEVASLEWVKASVPVYNLHTNHESHNYFANGILVHNIYKKHEGGIVEQHHGGEFAGKLKSNEVFSKLLKGEYVATEGQMSNFMGNILPRIANQPTGTSIKNGETNISMPIHVEGNLDKSVLPDLEKMMNKTFEKMNAALMSRGYKRSTDQVL